MNNSEIIRIGIVGAGSIVKQRHLPGLRALENVEIVAVANSTPASAQRFCEEFAPDAKVIEKWEHLVALPEIDVVWIGTTPYLHAPITLAALEADKHVFCQARMAMNLAEAEAMLAAARQHSNQVTMLCSPPFGMRWDAVMKDLLQSNTLGDIHALHLRSMNAVFADPDAPAHWRQRREISGNQILALGIHVEVLNRWFGDIHTVSAQGSVVHRIRQGYEVTIPDYAQVLCRFENGIHGVLEFSGIHVGPAEDVLEVSGSKARLRYDYLKDEIFIAEKGATTFTPLNPPREKAQPWRVEADFIDAVRGGAQPHPDFADGHRYMQTVEAVTKSLGESAFPDRQRMS